MAVTVPEGTSGDTKELFGALGTAITSFLTASFVSWAGEREDSKLADHIREAFWNKYKRAGSTATLPGVKYFVAGSAGERWVYADEYGGVDGWSRGARVKRARGIAAELASRASDP